MRSTRTAAVSAAAVAALLAGAGGAAADTGGTSAPTTPSAHASAAAKGPTGDGARALCRRVPRIDARIDRALQRLNGPVTERGSILRLQKRVDNADARGDTAVAKYLKDRLAFRTSLVPMLNQRSSDLDAVRTWCDAEHLGVPKRAHATGTSTATTNGTAK